MIQEYGETVGFSTRMKLFTQNSGTATKWPTPYSIQHILKETGSGFRHSVRCMKSRNSNNYDKYASIVFFRPCCPSLENITNIKIKDIPRPFLQLLNILTHLSTFHNNILIMHLLLHDKSKGNRRVRFCCGNRRGR